jgi:hypothetical protein
VALLSDAVRELLSVRTENLNDGQRRAAGAFVSFFNKVAYLQIYLVRIYLSIWPDRNR